MAETFGTRPSELLGIVEPEQAFYLDEALFVKLRLAQADELERRRTGGQQPGVRRFGPPEEIFDLPMVEA